MRTSLICILLLTLSCSILHAEDRGKLLFEDDFNRNESQEVKDEPGNGWSTNSNSRAKGHKQVDLRDGTLHIFIHKEADHAVSVRHDAEFRDGFVTLRFQLEHPKDTLTLNFADAKEKSVHAGHLFRVTTGVNKLEIADLKTGTMNLKTREARKAKRLTPEMKQLLATKKKAFPLTLKNGQWYTLDVTIFQETVSVNIDGKPVGSFSSAGIAHPTKRMLRLSVPREVVIDDLKFYSNAP